MKQLAVALLSVLAAFAASSAQATVVVTNTTQVNSGYAVSNTDLLQTHLRSSSFSGNYTVEGSNGAAAFTNGIFGNLGNPGTGESATGVGGNVATFNLDGAYNLTSIDSYAGWDNYRGGQSYDVYYATLANPSTYLLLASVYNNAVSGGNTNTRANIIDNSGFLATNVTSLRFNFSDNLAQGYNGYREIDVQGSRAVPEPGSIALLGLGLAGLAGFARRKQG